MPHRPAAAPGPAPGGASPAAALPGTLAVMPTTIENPILNSPFREPSRHFRFDEDGITTEVVEGRRLSTYFVPIPAPKKKGGAQLSLGMQGDWTAERMKANDFINDVRR